MRCRPRFPHESRLVALVSAVSALIGGFILRAVFVLGGESSRHSVRKSTSSSRRETVTRGTTHRLTQGDAAARAFRPAHNPERSFLTSPACSAEYTGAVRGPVPHPDARSTPCRHSAETPLIVGAGLAIAGAAAALAYAARQITAPAKGIPNEFLIQPRKLDQYVTVCLGASIMHGRVSVDIVDLLRQRLPEPEHAFVNAGINGDLAWNALQRLPLVIACDPDAVVVLGRERTMCLRRLSERVAKMAIKGKKLPTVPTLSWYAENLSRIVLRPPEVNATRACGAVLPSCAWREPGVRGGSAAGGV